MRSSGLQDPFTCLGDSCLDEEVIGMGYVVLAVAVLLFVIGAWAMRSASR